MLEANVWPVTYWAANILYVFTIYTFLDHFLKEPRVPGYIIFFAYTAYYFIIGTAFFRLHNFYINLLMNLLMMFLIGYLYETVIAQQMLGAVFFYTIGIACEVGTAGIIGFLRHVNVQIILGRHAYMIMGTIYSKLLLFIVAQLFVRLMVRHDERRVNRFPAIYTGILFLIPAGSAFVLSAMFVNNLKDAEYPLLLVMSVMVMALLNCLVFYLYDRLEAEGDIRLQNMLLTQQIESLSRQKQITQTYEENLRTVRHDMKNHLLTISSLAGKENAKGIESYIGRLMDTVESAPVVNSGNLQVDAILNYKYSIAQQNGIDFHFALSIPEQMTLDEMDMTVILGNLLDNAIEACVKLPLADRRIKLTLDYSEGCLLIVAENTYTLGSIRRMGGRICSTKADWQSHGLGLCSVQSTINRYRGELIIDTDESHQKNVGIFKASVIIYL